MKFLDRIFKPEQSGGIWEVLRIAFPLVLASAGNTINLFTDRVMLTHYSDDAMSAAFPAGLTSFSLACFFLGAAGYANAFVAQYVGAGRLNRVGPAVWQGIFLSLLGGLILLPFYVIADPMFHSFGHEARLIPLEVQYFRILILGNVVMLLNVALCNFWGGRGKTLIIMTANLMITACNVPLNYLLIFGRKFTVAGQVLEIPELGIAGAAIGTVCSGLIGLIFLSILFFAKKNRQTYSTASNIFDWELFRRLLRFGTPNGIQFFLDLTSFNAFIIILGRISPTVLAASGVAFAMNSIAFTPMIGIGQTVAILVGQAVGAQNIPHAERSIRSARLLILGYMACMAMLFVVHPQPILELFSLKDPAAVEMTRKMLRFIAAYLLFDGMFILYGSAIKGAGDTRFAMYMGAGMAWSLFAIPCMVAHFVFDCSVWTLWKICVGYIMCSGSVFYLRYRSGKWKSMHVIEMEANDHPRGALPKRSGAEIFLP